jgi:hypothetical protein
MAPVAGRSREQPATKTRKATNPMNPVILLTTKSTKSTNTEPKLLIKNFVYFVLFVVPVKEPLITAAAPFS